MMRRIDVHLLPRLVEPEALADSTVAVIDVLRATTTLVAAMAAGAREAIACQDVEEARFIAAKLPRGQAVLGGERGGVRIEGFDLGNSPREYTADSVGGRTLVFTTTNGTQAIARCYLSSKVYLASFTNLSRAAARLAEAGEVHILCAGTAGAVTREDTLLAGALVAETALPDTALNDEAQLALDEWRRAEICSAGPVGKLERAGAEHAAITARLAAALADSAGGRNLARVGLAADIVDCADIDRYRLVPEVEPASKTVLPSDRSN